MSKSFDHNKPAAVGEMSDMDTNCVAVLNSASHKPGKGSGAIDNGSSFGGRSAVANMRTIDTQGGLSAMGGHYGTDGNNNAAIS